MNKEFVTFHTRQERIAYVARRFAPLLRGRVLDVGCDQATLHDLLPGLDYTGVDRAAPADPVQDLDRDPILPFPERSFQCVLCIDVLEHLEHLHTVFAELVRVCDGNAVISWHNCWVNARRPITRGRGSFSHYGLPLEPPGDRHKWFFSLSEAWDFVRHHEARLPYRIAEAFVTEKPRPLPLRLLRRLRWPRQAAYDNRYSHTLWTVLARR